MKQREDRAVTGRETEDREWEILRNQEWHSPSDLQNFTPPPRPGEHLGWVAKGDRNATRERRRIAEGYRPVRYGDYVDFRPYKNLLAAGTVSPDEAVMFGDDLALMRIPEELIAKKRAHIARESADQIRGAYGIQGTPREAGIKLVDQTRTERSLERHGQPKDVSFGDA